MTDLYLVYGANTQLISIVIVPICTPIKNTWMRYNMKSQNGLICILLMSKDVWDFMKLKENSYCKRNMNGLKGLNRKKFSAHLTEVSRIDEELSWQWSNDSVDKQAYHSQREPRFDLQYPHDGSQPSLTPVQEDPMPFLTSLGSCTHGTWKCALVYTYMR